MCVKGLGETHLTLDGRLLLLLYLLLKFIQPKTRKAGNSKLLIFSPQIKFSGENSLLKMFVVSYGSFTTNRISSQAVGQCGPCPVPHTERQYSEAGGSMNLALWLLPVAITYEYY